MLDRFANYAAPCIFIIAAFPAGILQPPFFKGGYPRYLNFGAIGMVRVYSTAQYSTVQHCTGDWARDHPWVRWPGQAVRRDRQRGALVVSANYWGRDNILNICWISFSQWRFCQTVFWLFFRILICYPVLLQNFAVEAQCFIDQYDGYEVPELEDVLGEDAHVRSCP